MDKPVEEPRDEMIEAEVERALRLYRHHLTNDQLAGLESMVRDLLQNDPTAVELLAAARPRTAPLQTSGEEAPSARAKKPADER